MSTSRNSQTELRQFFTVVQLQVSIKEEIKRLPDKAVQASVVHKIAAFFEQKIPLVSQSV